MELQERITSEKPHIIVVTEVNPKNQQISTTRQELDVKGYTTFTNVTEEGRHGKLILIKNQLNAIESPIMQEIHGQEVVAAEFLLKGGDKQLIMGVYRNPNSTEENNSCLNSMIPNVGHWSYSHVLIPDDFNHPEIIWDGGGELSWNSNSASIFFKQ